MTRLYEDESSLEDVRGAGRDREISLGTGVILGIFLALAIVCAIFFGFGYSLGRRSAAPVATALAMSAAEPQVSSVGSKPSPGSPAGSRVGAQMDQPQQDEADTASGSATSPQRRSTREPAAVADRAAESPSSGARDRSAPLSKIETACPSGPSGSTIAGMRLLGLMARNSGLN